MGINGGRGIVGSGSVLGGSGISLAGGGGNDPDAQAFIDAAGITGETQQLALNQLVLDLKGTGSTTNNTDVWSKIYAVYPFCPIDDVTANAACYKWNLKDPRDLDAAFRLTFTNTPVYSLSLGLEQNASANGYGNTHFVESANMVAGNNGFTFSAKNFRNTTEYLLGALTSSYIFGLRQGLNVRAYSGVSLPFTNSSDGILSASRVSATEFNIYKNGVFDKTSATSYSSQATIPVFLLALNTGIASNISTISSISFMTIHNGLTDNESQDIYDAINTWETAIGR